MEAGHLAHGRLHLLPGGTVDLVAAAAVDVHIDETRGHQHITEVDDQAVRSRPAAAHLDHRCALDDQEPVLDQLGRGGQTRTF